MAVNRLFRLQVFTQEKKVFDDDIRSVVVPAHDGYIGVLAGHAPLITLLGNGKLTIHTPTDELRMRLAGGFLEVVHNTATILADALDHNDDAD